ncbi:hypothetical protein [Pseudomonas aeruginosa]|uniref:hypothetical protein n=1 Tax=Pseudomonas aeruginosa TaxID=287 RepID=UPI00223C7700|nr:hypothetical protein [Pseudomonas aeruginosa]
MSRVFVSPLATPFHLLVSIFPIPSRYISIFHAPSPRYFSPSLIKRSLRSRAGGGKDKGSEKAGADAKGRAKSGASRSRRKA